MPSQSKPTPVRMIGNAESPHKTDGRFLLDNSLEPTRTITSVRDPALFSPSANDRDAEPATQPFG